MAITKETDVSVLVTGGGFDDMGYAKTHSF